MEGGKKGRTGGREKEGREGAGRWFLKDRQFYDMDNRGGVVGHSTVHFIDVPQTNSKSGLLYQTEESLKLNLWRLFYRKNTKLSPIHKTLSLPCSMRLNCETKQSQTTLHWSWNLRLST